MIEIPQAFKPSASICKVLAVVYTPAILLLAFIAYQDEVPSQDITRDAIAVAELPFYVGALSSLGVVFWCATASICFFVYCFARIYRLQLSVEKYLLFSGLLSTMKMVSIIQL